MAEEGQALQLNFSLALQQIIDLDEKNQLLKTNIWLTFNWYDVNLRWNEVSPHMRIAYFIVHPFYKRRAQKGQSK